MDKIRALRERFKNRDTGLDRAELALIALEILDVVNVLADALVDNHLDASEIAAIGREVTELRQVVAEALAD
jgi:hypothetical protein